MVTRVMKLAKQVIQLELPGISSMSHAAGLGSTRVLIYRFANNGRNVNQSPSVRAHNLTFFVSKSNFKVQKRISLAQ